MKKLNNFFKYCLRSTLFFAVLLIVYMIVRRDLIQQVRGNITIYCILHGQF